MSTADHRTAGTTITASTIALRDYQEDAIAAVTSAEQRGIRRQLVVMPTGSGKTVVFAAEGRRRKVKALVLNHREELINQSADKFRAIDPTVSIGIIKADRNELAGDVLVASVPTISNPNRLAQLPDDIGLVFADEAHHAVAPSWRRILEHLRAGEPDGPLLVGFTATADRGDGIGLSAVFDEVVYDLPMIDLIEQGYLSDIKAKQIRLEVDYNHFHSRGGDYVASEVERALSEAMAPEHAVQAYRDHADGRKTIIFTPTIALAGEMAETFAAAGFSAVALSGDTPPNERRQILRDFKTGAVTIVANAMVLAEGFDEPSVDCIIIARPTKSRGLYSQMIGRGTRRHPGKDYLQVLDLVGASTRLDLVTTASLMGLPVDALEAADGELVGIAEAVATQREQEAGERLRGELVARNVSLFRQRAVNWIKVGDDRFVLSFGQGSLFLQECDQDWRLTLRPTVGDRSVLATGKDLGYLQGFAEDYVRSRGGSVLINPNARWRFDPVTDGQIRKMRYLGIAWTSVKTKGEATDLITAAEAMREVA